MEEASYRNRKYGSLGVGSALLFITQRDRYRRHLPCDPAPYCGPASQDTMCTTSAQSAVEYRSQSRGGEHRGDVLSTQYMGTWGGPQYMGQLVEPMGTWAIGTWALYFFFWGEGGDL